jgi:hypothetical protein
MTAAISYVSWSFCVLTKHKSLFHIFVCERKTVGVLYIVSSLTVCPLFSWLVESVLKMVEFLSVI